VSRGCSSSIFDRHSLRTAGLHIALDPAQTGKEISLFSVKEVITVELGGDLDGEVQARPGLLHRAGLGHGPQEITTQANKGLDRSVEDAAAGCHRIEPFFRRRIEAVKFLQFRNGREFGFSVMPTVRCP
jgi:hypothetical protein